MNGGGLAVLGLALVAASGAPAGDAGHGKLLHDQDCSRCHDAAMYTRPQRTVKTFAELRERVQQCELAAELLWFEEDVDDVAAYLDRTFYRFSEEPAK